MSFKVPLFFILCFLSLLVKLFAHPPDFILVSLTLLRKLTICRIKLQT